MCSNDGEVSNKIESILMELAAISTNCYIFKAIFNENLLY